MLKGQFVTPRGAKATGLAGKAVRLRGDKEHLRKLALVDADGAFEFDGVIPDIYFLTLGDLEHPDVASGATSIYPGSTKVTMTLVYPDGGASAKVFQRQQGEASRTARPHRCAASRGVVLPRQQERAAANKSRAGLY